MYRRVNGLLSQTPALVIVYVYVYLHVNINI
jgi:hypothetical protein